MMSNEIVGIVESFDSKVIRISRAIDKGIEAYAKRRLVPLNLVKLSSYMLDELSKHIVTLDYEFTRWDIRCDVLSTSDSFCVLEISTNPGYPAFTSSMLTVVIEANEYKIVNLKLAHNDAIETNTTTLLGDSCSKYTALCSLVKVFTQADETMHKYVAERIARYLLASSNDLSSVVAGISIKLKNGKVVTIGK
jgi:hypothetical protein